MTILRTNGDITHLSEDEIFELILVELKETNIWLQALEQKQLLRKFMAVAHLFEFGLCTTRQRFFSLSQP